MRCTDFENRLNDLLDERRFPHEDLALLAHADSCADCREVLAAQESLFRGLTQLQRRTISADLGNRVLRHMAATSDPATLLPAAESRNSWRLFASAAVILLAVSFGLWLVNRDSRRTVVNPAAPRGASRGEGLAIAKPGNRRPNSAPSTSPTNSPIESGIVVPSPALPPGSVVENPLTSALPPAVVPLDEKGQAYREAMASLASQWSTNAHWPPVETLDVEQYAPGFRPIRETFEVALDALLRTIPGKKEVRQTPPQALQLNDDLFNIA